MCSKYRLASLVENRKLLFLVAVLFVLVFSLQYLELPNGHALSSLFSAGKTLLASVGNLSNGNSSNSFSSTKSLGERNLTSSDGLNSTNQSTFHWITEATELADGKDSNEKVSDDSLDFGSDSDPEDEFPSKDSIELNLNLTVAGVGGINGLASEKSLQDPQNAPSLNATSTKIVSLNRNDRRSIAPSLARDDVDTGLSNLSATVQPSDSPPPFKVPTGTENNSQSAVVSFALNAFSVDKDADNTSQKVGSPVTLNTDLMPSVNSSSMNGGPIKNEKSKGPEGAVVSISEMNEILNLSQTFYRSKEPRWTKSSDQELLLAKSLIQSSSSVHNEPSLHAPLFRNFSMFKRSYELMEQTLKVYIYKEGERPICHQPVLKGIYASEGWFMKLLKTSKHFVTKNPKKAHLFYLPFSSRMLEETLYVPNSHNRTSLIQYLNNYLNLIRSRYSFWNRTEGADHFLVACHDWAPSETRRIMANCIRALCNSDIKEGFQFGKDVSLAETNVRSPENPLRALGGQPPSKRPILAFFAGNMHGYLRPILLEHWQNKDPDMKIFGRMPDVKGQMNYIRHMKSSKYCICAKGYEVNSPRVVEAIFYECVPVIISDNYVPPFFKTLNWESFAVFVPERDIPNLKNILVSIPERRYRQMQKRVRLVQQHFLWHSRPLKYDIFHMILHSIWHTRVFQL